MQILHDIYGATCMCKGKVSRSSGNVSCYISYQIVRNISNTSAGVSIGQRKPSGSEKCETAVPTL